MEIKLTNKDMLYTEEKFIDASGAMKTGWVTVGGKWYYLNASGVWVR